MRSLNFYLFVVAVIVCACGKDNGSSPPTSTTKLFLTAVPDSAFIAVKGYVDIKGGIEGSRADYSGMQVFLVTKNLDTIGSANVDGKTFSIRLDSTLPAGEYQVNVTAKDPDAEKMIVSEVVRVFSCIPPPVDISSFEVDEKSVTITWFASKIEEFKAYQIYASRAGYDSAKLIATITDENVSMYKDTTASFYYKYSYSVRTLSKNDCRSAVRGKEVQSGKGEALGENVDITNAAYDLATNTLYYTWPTPNNFQYKASIVKVPIDDIGGISGISSFKYGAYVAGVDENAQVQVISTTETNDRQLNWLTPFTGDLGTNSNNLNLSLISDRVKGVWDRDMMLYTGFDQGDRYVRVYEHSTNQHTSIYEGDYINAIPIERNNRFVVTTASDSFFVYSTQNHIAELQAKGKVQGLSSMPAKNVFYASGILVIGGSIFDSNNNFLRALPAGEFITGISADGSYIATSKNEILETATLTKLHTFGDGFPGIVYFTSDNSTIIHLTDGDNQHSARMNKYKWR